MRFVLLTVVFLAASPAMAQQKADMKGGTVVASEPGKAAMARAAVISAEVMAVDRFSRVLTLKGPKGNVQDVVISPDVKNFDNIKAGDFVMVRFVQSLALELQKTKSADGSKIDVKEEAVKAKPGERPAIAGAREITAIAKVTAVNKKDKTITLRGPRGNSVTLDVNNPDQFKVVKVGDEVKVQYTEAVAVSVEPAQKPSAKK